MARRRCGPWRRQSPACCPTARLEESPSSSSRMAQQSSLVQDAHEGALRACSAVGSVSHAGFPLMGLLRPASPETKCEGSCPNVKRQLQLRLLGSRHTNSQWMQGRLPEALLSDDKAVNSIQDTGTSRCSSNKEDPTVAGALTVCVVETVPQCSARGVTRKDMHSRCKGGACL